MPRLMMAVSVTGRVVQKPSGYSIHQVESRDFDQFLTYLNNHLSENGEDGVTYFQPRSRKEARFPSERAAAFRAALDVTVGQVGWRRLWVARDSDGQIVGHIDLRAHVEPYAEHRCLVGMGVDRDHRKIGLDKILVEHAEEWLKTSALLEWMDLQVLSNNTKAVRLYERMGFQRTGETSDMFRIDGQSFSFTAMARHVRKANAGDA